MQKPKLILSVLAILVLFGVSIVLGLMRLESKGQELLSVRHLAFSPNGVFLATVGDVSGTIGVFDVQSRSNIAVLHSSPKPWDLRFSSDGAALISWGKEDIVFWDTANWQEIKRLKLTTPPDTVAIELAPNAKMTAFLRGFFGETPTKSVAICDIEKHEDVFSISLDDNSYYYMAFSSDGSLLVLAPKGKGPAKIVDLASHQTVFEILPAETDPKRRVGMSAASFSPDGRMLALAEWKGPCISLWDVTKRKRLGILRPKSVMLDLAFSADGKLLAGATDLAGQKSELRVWNWREGTEIFTLRLKGSIRCVAFSPDGKTLAYGLVGAPGDLGFLNVEDLYKTDK